MQIFEEEILAIRSGNVEDAAERYDIKTGIGFKEALLIMRSWLREIKQRGKRKDHDIQSEYPSYIKRR